MTLLRHERRQTAVVSLSTGCQTHSFKPKATENKSSPPHLTGHSWHSFPRWCPHQPPMWTLAQRSLASQIGSSITAEPSYLYWEQGAQWGTPALMFSPWGLERAPLPTVFPSSPHPSSCCFPGRLEVTPGVRQTLHVRRHTCEVSGWID